jgi:hypothetical protein
MVSLEMTGSKDPHDVSEELLDLFVRNLTKDITYPPIIDAVKAAWIKTRSEWRARKEELKSRSCVSLKQGQKL